MKMDETSKEEGNDEAFRKCERRGRRGACPNVEIPPTEKIQEMFDNLKITEKEEGTSKNDAGKGT